MIDHTLLVASCDFSGRLSAGRAAAAIARGLSAAGLPEPDQCPISAAHSLHGPVMGMATGEGGASVRELLDGLGFDARMRAAHAVIVGDGRLDPRTLSGSVVFEIATRARQGGVPAYAITAENALSAFDARVLDLQVILEARGERALETAGRQLAGLVRCVDR
ncbi:MAG TPA: glycerate kinase [Solirubrobacteraceae bacterium]|nr:glycerate kinase [Solirubrobacteraceae bacterium]